LDGRLAFGDLSPAIRPVPASIGKLPAKGPVGGTSSDSKRHAARGQSRAVVGPEYCAIETLITVAGDEENKGRQRQGDHENPQEHSDDWISRAPRPAAPA
jgi:hypothetical protein